MPMQMARQDENGGEQATCQDREGECVDEDHAGTLRWAGDIPPHWKYCPLHRAATARKEGLRGGWIVEDCPQGCPKSDRCPEGRGGTTALFIRRRLIPPDRLPGGIHGGPAGVKSHSIVLHGSRTTPIIIAHDWQTATVADPCLSFCGPGTSDHVAPVPPSAIFCLSFSGRKGGYSSFALYS